MQTTHPDRAVRGVARTRLRAGIAAVVVASLGFGALAAAPSANASGVNIPDPGLLDCLQWATGVEDLTEALLADLTSVDCTGLGISDLTGVEDLTGVVTLDLTGNEVLDASPLAGLPKLETLRIADNRLADLRPLAQVSTLVEADLANNAVVDTAPLASLSRLRTLDLSDNAVADASPLAGLSAVRVLRLDGNQVWDLASLAALPDGAVRADGQRLATTVVAGVPKRFPLRNRKGEVPAGLVLPSGWTLVDGMLGGGTREVGDLQFAEQGEPDADGNRDTFSGEIEVTTLLSAAAASLTTRVPTIYGEAKLGETLTASVEAWEPEPVDITFRWLRNDYPISGATRATYQLQAADVGATLVVEASGSKDGYTSDTTTSKPTAVVVAGTVVATTPTVSGVARVGEQLTATAEPWGPDGIEPTPQWLRSGAVIPGATGWNYRVAAADLGARLSVRLTATATGYATTSRTSASTAKVTSGVISGVVPTIKGELRVGEQLTVDPGTWGPDGVVLTQRWYRSGTKIKSATKSTYTLTSADLGKRITVKVTGKLAGFTTVGRTSAKIAKIARGVLTSAVPVITGTPVVGTPLVVDRGTWGPGTVKLAVQWYRNGKAISKATKTTYTPKSSDVGKLLTVRVTGSKSGFTTVKTLSDPTTAVTKTP